MSNTQVWLLVYTACVCLLITLCEMAPVREDLHADDFPSL